MLIPYFFPTHLLPLLRLEEYKVLPLPPAYQGQEDMLPVAGPSLPSRPRTACSDAQLKWKVSSSMGAENRVLVYFRSWNTKNHKCGSSRGEVKNRLLVNASPFLPPDIPQHGCARGLSNKSLEIPSSLPHLATMTKPISSCYFPFFFSPCKPPTCLALNALQKCSLKKLYEHFSTNI